MAQGVARPGFGSRKVGERMYQAQSLLTLPQFGQREASWERRLGAAAEVSFPGCRAADRLSGLQLETSLHNNQLSYSQHILFSVNFRKVLFLENLLRNSATIEKCLFLIFFKIPFYFHIYFRKSFISFRW